MLLLLLTAAAIFVLLHGASWYDEHAPGLAGPQNVETQPLVNNRKEPYERDRPIPGNP